MGSTRSFTHKIPDSVCCTLVPFSPLPHHTSSTTTRSPTISSNHVPLFIDNISPNHLAVIDGDGDAILMNLNPFSHSPIVFLPMPHHHPSESSPQVLLNKRLSSTSSTLLNLSSLSPPFGLGRSKEDL
jgi:hypothetical protein